MDMELLKRYTGTQIFVTVVFVLQLSSFLFLEPVQGQYAPEYPTQFFVSARTGPLPGASIQEAANFVVFGSKRGFDELNYTATDRKNLRTELVSKLEKQGISTDGAIIDYDGTDPLPLNVLVDAKLGTVSIVASQNPSNSSALFVPIWSDYTKLQRTLTARTGDPDVDAFVYDVYESRFLRGYYSNGSGCTDDICAHSSGWPSTASTAGPYTPWEYSNFTNNPPMTSNGFASLHEPGFLSDVIGSRANPKAAIPEYRIKQYAYNLASFNSADNLDFTGDPEFGNLGTGTGLTAVTATSPSKNTWAFNVVQVFGTPSFTAHNRAQTYTSVIKKGASKSGAGPAPAPSQPSSVQSKSQP